jgi:hypothetical protein
MAFFMLQSKGSMLISPTGGYPDPTQFYESLFGADALRNASKMEPPGSTWTQQFAARRWRSRGWRATCPAATAFISTPENAQELFIKDIENWRGYVKAAKIEPQG